VMAARGAPVNDILQAAMDAGHQLVVEGAMSRQSLATVSRPLISLEDYIKGANQGAKLKQGVTD
jgi:hypothetical protein